MPGPQTRKRVALAALVAEMRASPLSRALFDDRSRLMMVIDLDGTVVDVNGFDSGDGVFLGEAVVGQPVWATPASVADASWEGPWRARMEAALEADGPTVSDAEFTAPRGQRFAVRTEVTVLRLGSGEPIGFLVESSDIRAERDTVQRLRASEERFRVMAEALPQMVWVSDGHGRVEYFSPRWVEFTGRPLDELLGRGFLDFMHPDDRHLAGAVPSEDGVASYQFRLLRHDGVYRWMEARMRAVHAPDGTRIHWIGGTGDVTEQRAAADNAHAQEEYLRATLELTQYGTYTWFVAEDRFSEDSQLDAVFGIPMEPLIAGNAFEQFFGMVHPDDRERAMASVLGAIIPGGPDYQAEFRIFSPGDDGPVEHWCSAMGRTEFDDQGQPIRLIGVFADITARRQEDDARLRLQKLEAMGTLASGIAHDFNNVIGAILSYARVAEAEYAAGESPVTSMGEIARGAMRAGDIVKRLLTFSREEAPKRESFQLGAIAEEACALVRPALPAGVKVHLSVGSGMPELLGDPTQVHQVVVNLITNAGQAIGLGPGRIDVGVDEVALGERRVGTLASLAPGDYLRLRVSDDGPGIPDAVLARIFDPFFTTKGPAEGTGLGLAAVQSVVRNHGGVISAESLPGSGASFTAYLPVDEDAPVAAPTAEPAAPHANDGDPGAARVLFVDDEEALVRLAYRAMPYCGCSVQGFTDPRQALAALEAEPQAFDALVTDLSMPGMNGLELTDRVRAVRSDLPVVMTSGYMGTDDQEDAIRRGVDVIMPKPCSIDDLAGQVLLLLGR